MSKDDKRQYDEVINILTEIIKRLIHQEREVITNGAK
ncbi:hypothetical protein SAMN05446037_105017 [Anaerovirgula multivorans]|uniref:Uncharacterized protein n=1 Tax=Anaerovirgula multivorans TaxID=312168 RepID=A0A239KMH5_9FIRM|nr:hypothetical protein SAMN05446037_105017 [Anaerovirgula multivorans]